LIHALAALIHAYKVKPFGFIGILLSAVFFWLVSNVKAGLLICDVIHNGADQELYVVKDGLLITGQNPGSSAATAALLLEQFVQ